MTREKSRRSRLLLKGLGSSASSWWISDFPGAIWAADFTQNLGMVSGVQTALTDMLNDARNSSQLVENADGTLTSVALLALPISDLGLAPWEARTNAIAGLTAVNAAISTDTGAAPNSEVEADTLTANAGAGSHYLVNTAPNSTVSVGAKYTCSAYIKAGTAQYVGLYFSGTAFPADERMAVFDVISGTVSEVQSNVTARIHALANGWFKLSISRTMTSNTQISTGAFISDDGTVAGQSFTANGTETFHFWSVQFEAGAVAGPALAFSETRAASNIEAENTNWYSGEDIYILVETDAGQIGQGAARHIASLRDTDTVNERVDYFQSATEKIEMAGVAGGVTTLSAAATTSVAVGTKRHAIRVKDDDASVIYEGAEEGTDTSGSLNQNLLDQFLVGQGSSGGANYNGYIRKLAVIPTSEITEADVLTWTAG